MNVMYEKIMRCENYTKSFEYIVMFSAQQRHPSYGTSDKLRIRTWISKPSAHAADPCRRIQDLGLWTPDSPRTQDPRIQDSGPETKDRRDSQRSLTRRVPLPQAPGDGGFRDPPHNIEYLLRPKFSHHLWVVKDTKD